MHDRNCAHVDIKPENLVLSFDYKLKIIDFDISYDLGQEKAKIPQGTPHYRPPEMINRKCKSYKPCDIYSAGIVLFSLMTGGKLPFFEEPPKNVTEESKEVFRKLKENFYNDSTKFWAFHC